MKLKTEKIKKGPSHTGLYERVLHCTHVMCSTLCIGRKKKSIEGKMSRNPTRGDEDKTVIEKREQEERKG